MKTKHTPGPWTVESLEIAYVVRGPTGLPVSAVLFSDNPHGSIKHAEANAQLISAAPDMLEALEELNCAIIAYIKPGTMATETRLCKAHLLALKAMGKATGGAE